MTIHLALMLPSGSSDQPEGHWPSTLIALLFGLAPGGVCSASQSPGCWWALTPPFHPYPRRKASPTYQWSRQGKPSLHLALLGRGRAVCFCGTFRRVTPPGRYPAPCSVELGLSSLHQCKAIIRSTCPKVNL
jgi:hypothetical protein